MYNNNSYKNSIKFAAYISHIIHEIGYTHTHVPRVTLAAGTTRPPIAPTTLAQLYCRLLR